MGKHEGPGREITERHWVSVYAVTGWVSGWINWWITWLSEGMTDQMLEIMSSCTQTFLPASGLRKIWELDPNSDQKTTEFRAASKTTCEACEQGGWRPGMMALGLVGLIISDLPYQASVPKAESIWDGVDRLGLVDWSRDATQCGVQGSAATALLGSILEMWTSGPTLEHQVRVCLIKFEKYSSRGLWKILEAGGVGGRRGPEITFDFSPEAA